MLSNYHTHTWRCGHASGNATDYASEAIRHGLSELGISDHGPLPDYYFDRMPLSDFNEYLLEIDQAREKFGNKISIYTSLEIEYFPEFNNHYKNLLNKTNYLLLGHHYFKRHLSSWHVDSPVKLIQYTNELIQAMQSGYFSMIAHPDLFAYSYPRWDQCCIEASERICSCAKELNIVLELNANGIRKGLHQRPEGLRYLYPRQEFWEIASNFDISTILSADCHCPTELFDNSMQLSYKLAQEWKLRTVNRPAMRII